MAGSTSTGAQVSTQQRGQLQQVDITGPVQGGGLRVNTAGRGAVGRHCRVCSGRKAEGTLQGGRLRVDTAGRGLRVDTAGRGAAGRHCRSARGGCTGREGCGLTLQGMHGVGDCTGRPMLHQAKEWQVTIQQGNLVSTPSLPVGHSA